MYTKMKKILTIHLVTMFFIALFLVNTNAKPITPKTSGIADYIYEYVPNDGARLIFSDNASDGYIDQYIDLDPHPNDGTVENEFEIGTMFIYGDGNTMTESDDSFDDLIVKLGIGMNGDTLVPPVDRFYKLGLITRDTSNPENVIYDTFAFFNNPSGANLQKVKVETRKRPLMSIVNVRQIIDDTLTNGETDSNIVYTPGSGNTNGQVKFRDLLKDKIKRSTQQIGTPDVLHFYIDDVWVYLAYYDLNDNLQEKLFHVNIKLAERTDGSEVGSDEEPSDVINFKVAARGPVTRIEYTPDFDDDATTVAETQSTFDSDYISVYGVDCGDGVSWCDPDDVVRDAMGINGFLVQVTGDHDTSTTYPRDGEVDNLFGVTKTWFTKSPVMFLRTDIGDDYQVKVFTVNAEGDTSNGVVEDIYNQDEWTSDLVQMDGSHLNDETLDRENNPEGLSQYFNHIQFLYKMGVIDGYSDGYYYEDRTVDRAQLSKFVMNAFHIPFDITGERFPDIHEDNSFFPYIQSLKNAGIIHGFSTGCFFANCGITEEDINIPVDRSQATKFIFNAANYYDLYAIDKGGSDCFADVAGNHFADYICGLASFHDSQYIQPPVEPFNTSVAELTYDINKFRTLNFEPAYDLQRGVMAKMMINTMSAVPVATNLFDTGTNDYVDGMATSFTNYFWHWIDPVTNLTDYGTIHSNIGTTYRRGFLRPFIEPVPVEDFNAYKESASTVTLEWDDLTLEDLSVDGYLIEKREAEDEDEDSWEPVEISGGPASITIQDLKIESVVQGLNLQGWVIRLEDDDAGQPACVQAGGTSTACFSVDRDGRKITVKVDTDGSGGATPTTADLEDGLDNALTMIGAYEFIDDTPTDNILDGYFKFTQTGSTQALREGTYVVRGGGALSSRVGFQDINIMGIDTRQITIGGTPYDFPANQDDIQVVIVDYGSSFCNIVTSDCTNFMDPVFTITINIDDADGNGTEGDIVTTEMIVDELNDNADAQQELFAWGGSSSTQIVPGTYSLANYIDPNSEMNIPSSGSVPYGTSEGVIVGRHSQLIDTDVDDNTNYDYRIQAFKFVPYEYSEDDSFLGDYRDINYTEYLQHPANYDEHGNMILGMKQCDSAKTLLVD